MIETCERCGVQSVKLEKCEYCKKKKCLACIKSSKRKKAGHLFICKDCWSSIKSRKTFKSYLKDGRVQREMREE